MPVTVTTASDIEIPELAHVAALTFPLACPPSSSTENIADFIAANLSPQRFTAYLADPGRSVFIARDEQRILGYAMAIRGLGADPDVSRAITLRPAVELSKLYVLPEGHGSGVAAMLMETSISMARDTGARCLWLGVNQKNQRAQRFYTKSGFAIVGTKTFQVGAHIESDYVMVNTLESSVRLNPSSTQYE